MNNSEHLKWIHDRLVNVYNENMQFNYMIKLREIIEMLDEQESNFDNYLKFKKSRNGTT